MNKKNLINMSSALYYILSNIIKNKKSAIFVVDDDMDVERLWMDAVSLKSIIDGDVDILKFDLDVNNQIKTIEFIYNSDTLKLIIASSKSINVSFPSKKSFDFFILKVSQTIKRNRIIDMLEESKFIRTNFVENNGEYAIRGSVIDIFNYGDDYPVRIYFDDDKIEAIRKFDIDSQNTFDFLMEFIVKDVSKKDESIMSFGFDCYSYSSLNSGFKIIEEEFIRNNIEIFNHIRFNNSLDFIKELKRFIDSGFYVYIFALNEKEIYRIYKMLEENKINNNIKFIEKNLNYGFYSNKDKISVFSSNDIFSRDYEYRNISKKNKKFYRLNYLEKGDYVVHEDYGIGIYRGIVDFTHRDEWGEIYQSECVEIEYSGGDKLFIGLDDFKKIQKYIAGENSKIKISSLSTTRWKAVKERVKKEVGEIAKDIIKLEAKRKLVKLKPMFKTDFEDDFALDFGWEETEDQIKAINDVLNDLESGVVANRVIVGDVGFGKTEVIMRAAFRAVTNDFQVCVLCPTTILVEQHYRNFKKRFEKFSINVKSLSRITPTKLEKEIISDLSKGVVDIIIATHRLLSDDIKFKNLGVLIIDEEHKFGVKQKEEIKKKYNNIHIFSLSATPIPRTLYQSISDIKLMSVIESPPKGRLSVDTKVLPYDDNVIIEAVNNEIRRNGQVYYVYNRVEFMQRRLEELKKLLPAINIAVVHGQMDGEDVENIMIDFMNKKYDLLLASTIIESGIDIPSVNTLIVEDSHKMGLSQLYQLRGRVGREKQKAYCYLFYPKWFGEDNKIINTDALKRLFALEEFSELGSGFRLAMRDLEIRGAGELLGTRQHGFINTIGLELYIKLLNEEISRLKGIKKEEEGDILIDIKISALIPENYITDDMERLNFYKRLFSANIDEIDTIVSKIVDISGPLPVEVKNLIAIIKFKKTVKNVRKIIEKNGNIEIYFIKNYKPDLSEIKRWTEEFKDRIRFFKTSEGDGLEIKILNQNRIDIIKNVLKLKV